MILGPATGDSLKKQFVETSEHHMNNKLFVGNLSFNTTESSLKDTFAAYGTVTEANLMTDRATGRSRGFAFVTMSSPEEAQQAIDALNGKSIEGRALTVNVARPREENSSGRARRQYNDRPDRY
jgi:cold-inducible RNA-binding protein